MADDVELAIAAAELNGLPLRQPERYRGTHALAVQRRAFAERVCQLASAVSFILRLSAMLAITIAPVRASSFFTTGSDLSTRTLIYRVTVFSDDPNSIHDPRHPQPQTGADKMFAPIGLIWTNHPQPDQGDAPTSHLHMGTAFLCRRVTS